MNEHMILAGMKGCEAIPRLQHMEQIVYSNRKRGGGILVFLINNKEYEILISKREYDKFIKFLKKNTKIRNL